MVGRSGLRAGRSRQQGNMLLGAIVSISLLSAGILAVLKMDAIRAENQLADLQGTEVAQFGVGLRGFVAAAQGNNALASGTRSGVDWLKAPSCGGLATNPSAGYVPCHYSGGTVGASFRTTFAVDAASNSITARMTYVAPTLGNTRRHSVFADRVALAAKADAGRGNNTSFFDVFSNVEATATAPGTVAGQVPGNTGRIVLVVSNAPSNDPYLRTDGTNRMQANFNGGGFSIGNVQDGDFSGNVRVRNQLQVDRGVTVTNGTGDFRMGIVTTDAAYTDIGAFASQGIYNAEVYSGAAAYNVPKQACSSSASTPRIFASLQATGNINSGAYRGDSLLESRVDVQDYGSYWRVTPVLVGSKFDLSLTGAVVTLNKQVNTLNPSDARIVVLRKCS